MMMVPVVVLTGFLGSGKTTLLNRLIAARAIGDEVGGPGKLALIVNELGEVGIDGALLPADRTRQVELPGGCICCVRSEDLDRTVLELLDSPAPISMIVIETTGVAEPLPIAWALSSGAVKDRVRLAAVVTLVDAANFTDSRRVSPAVDAQVAYADAIIVTKRDLVDAAQADAVGAAVAGLAPRAVRMPDGEDPVRWLREILEDPELGQGRDGVMLVAPRDHRVDSAWVPVDGEVDVEELCDQLAELPAHFIRIKGIVREGSLWWVVHRVGPRTSSEPLQRVPDGVNGRLVGLGPGVTRAPLAGCVERAMVTSVRPDP